jgi:hypothetical protein
LAQRPRQSDHTWQVVHGAQQGDIGVHGAGRVEQRDIGSDRGVALGRVAVPGRRERHRLCAFPNQLVGKNAENVTDSDLNLETSEAHDMANRAADYGSRALKMRLNGPPWPGDRMSAKSVRRLGLIQADCGCGLGDWLGNGF